MARLRGTKLSAIALNLSLGRKDFDTQVIPSHILLGCHVWMRRLSNQTVVDAASLLPMRNSDAQHSFADVFSIHGGGEPRSD